MARSWRELSGRLRHSRLFSALITPWTGDQASQLPDSLAAAGDMARAAHERNEALTLYGRAIDGYLAAGMHRRAESVCRRIIEMEPDVIRTRYTLAAIAVGRRSVRHTRARIDDYMEAVTRAHAAGHAIPSLLQLASASDHPAIRQILADALRRAGRPDYADGVERGTAAAAVSPGRDRATRAALTLPGDVDLAALTSS